MINGLTTDEVKAISDFIDAVEENYPKDNESGFYGFLEIRSAIMQTFKDGEFKIESKPQEDNDGSK